MNDKDLIKHSKRLYEIAKAVEKEKTSYMNIFTQGAEFLRKYGGKENVFYKEIIKARDTHYDVAIVIIVNTLKGFLEYLESGLLDEVTPVYQAQLDVVSGFLDQANNLLVKNEFHPGAAAVLIGATLEEFLRNWIEKEGIELGNKKPTIDSYIKLLKENEFISKQDIKDVTAWAGIRNDAAHGKWDEVNSKDKISLMLQGVNLFMRKYGNGKV